MKHTLRLIKNQPYDHPAKITGINVIKKQAKLLDTVTLNIDAPTGKLFHSFFIKHESEEDDAHECRQAFEKIFSDHVEAVSKQTLERILSGE